MKVGDLNCIFLKSGLQLAPNLAKFRKSNMTSQITVTNVTAATYVIIYLLWKVSGLNFMSILLFSFRVLTIILYTEKHIYNPVKNL